MKRCLIPITLGCICWLAAVAQSMAISVAEEVPENDVASSQDPEPKEEGNGAGAFIGLQPDEMSAWVEEQENRGDDSPLAEPAPQGGELGVQRHVEDIEDMRTAEFISAIVLALENDSNWRMPQPSGQLTPDDSES
ncbi:hypothetical protein GGI23_001442 [Coemansia sp. RSA 2559]|nr:hypothetical protein GGI23_001442 [Coemansia sp. RSA 2559]KAJ2866635.1 hypothetical protein GGI22_001237 [Coemansia erecta]